MKYNLPIDTATTARSTKRLLSPVSGSAGSPGFTAFSILLNTNLPIGLDGQASGAVASNLI